MTHVDVITVNGNRQVWADLGRPEPGARHEAWIRLCSTTAAGLERISGPEISGELPELDPHAESDALSSIALHRCLRGLSRVEASDSRLWNALALETYSTYVDERFPRVDVQWGTWSGRRLLPTDPSKRALLRHALSRLWWAVEMMRSPEDGDDGELAYARVASLWKRQDLFSTIMGQEIGGIGPLAVLLVEVVEELSGIRDAGEGSEPSESTGVSSRRFERAFLRRALQESGVIRLEYVAALDRSAAKQALVRIGHEVLVDQRPGEGG